MVESDRRRPTRNDYRKVALFSLLLLLGGIASITLGANSDSGEGVALTILGVVMLACVATLGVAVVRRR